MFMAQVRPLVDSDSDEEIVQRATKSTADSESESNSEDEFFRTGRYTERNRKAREAEVQLKNAVKAIHIPISKC